MICKHSEDKKHHMIADKKPLRDTKGIHYHPDTVWFCTFCKKTSKQIRHKEEIEIMRQG